MVKSELINRLATRLNSLPPKDIELCVNHIIEQMSSALDSGKRIEIRGFGSFEIRFRPPRIAHNPKDRTRVYTTAKHTPHFKPGKEMRERINQSRKTHPIQQQHYEEDSEE